MRVLIVDDEIKICKLIYRLIKWDELDLSCMGLCRDGEEAIEKIRQQVPDILITDIRMPNINGLMLIEELKREYPNLHIIIISGHNDFNYAHTAIKYGVEDYILKPIRKDELNNALEKIIVQDELVKRREKDKSILKLKLSVNSKKLKSSFLEKLIRQCKIIRVFGNKWLLTGKN